jgi:ADP-heptose:LPS heptosyltransferase
MIKYFMQKRVTREQVRNREITAAELAGAQSVLFSIFSRYGDGIIAFKIINEFLARHPDKAYYILTSHQLRPYAEALADRRARVLSVRKRSPHQMLRTVWRLKQAQIDVGFNPWGSRGDSEFFLTYAKRFYTFGSIKFAVTDNLYARVRRYLGLPQPEAGTRVWAATPPVRRLLVCPFSTDSRKSLPDAEVGVLLQWLKHKFPEARLTMALAEGEEHRAKKFHDGEWFFFGKSAVRSREFLRLVQETDLFAGVDAGPLHLADALGKPCLGLFGPTAPETIMDADSRILPLRSRRLQGIFCAVQICRDPLCLHALFQDGLETNGQVYSLHLAEERRLCRFLYPSSAGESLVPPVGQSFSNQDLPPHLPEEHRQAPVAPGGGAGEQHPEVVGAQAFEPALWPGWPFRQHLRHFSHLAPVKFPFFGLTQLPQAARPHFHFFIRLTGQRRRRSAGPRGEGKHMEIGHREGRHQGIRGGKIGGGFRGKTRQHIQPQGGVRKAPAKLQSRLPKLLHPVRPVHGPKHRVGAALQRQVEVGAEAGKFHQGLEQLRGDTLGLQGTQAQAEGPGISGQPPEQSRQRDGGLQVPTVLP